MQHEGMSEQLSTTAKNLIPEHAYLKVTFGKVCNYFIALCYKFPCRGFSASKLKGKIQSRCCPTVTGVWLPSWSRWERRDVHNTAIQLMVSVCKLVFVGGEDILILCFQGCLMEGLARIASSASLNSKKDLGSHLSKWEYFILFLFFLSLNH